MFAAGSCPEICPEIAAEKRGRSGSGVDEGDTNASQPTHQPLSGHVFKVERKRGAQWYALRTAPPAGYFTKASAHAWLDDTLV